MTDKNIQFAFFGGEPLSVPVLNVLYEKGFIPKLIVCNPDRPVGRKAEITPPPTKIWAVEHNVPVFQPESFKDGAVIEHLKKVGCDLFIVVAYGKIIPRSVLELPAHGTLNVHPSLLPLYRGPAPIVTSILNGDTETGVTIIKLDEEMDHGPILAQEKITLSENEYVGELEATLSRIGGELLADVLPKWIAGEIETREQDHSAATYVKKMVKEDGEIKLDGNDTENWRRYRAYFGWPGVYFFKDGKRIKITKATFENGLFIPDRVIPEGKKEINYGSFN